MDLALLKQRFLDKCREHLGEASLSHVETALAMAESFHEGQVRKFDGSPYVTHCLQVAEHCLDWGLHDEVAVAAALLHDAVEDAPAEMEAERRIGEMNPEILSLVLALSKIRNLLTGDGDMLATYRRILSAASKDLRVLLIKTFDQLHNAETLGVHNKAKAKAKASLGLIYVGIARRLGIQALADTLINILLPHLMPVQTGRAEKSLETLQRQSGGVLGNLHRVLTPLLREQLVTHWELEPKNLSDFFQLTEKPGTGSLQRVGWPVYRIRLVVADDDAAWRVLGRTHRIFGPMPRHVRDYLSAPRINGFRALTSRVFWKGYPLSIQVERESDTKANRMGILADWRHRTDHTSSETYMQLLKTLGDSDLRMTEVHAHVLPDTMDIYTPKGDRLTFPAGSVLVDLAYRLHTELGERCIGGKVNGIRCTPEQEMVDGDMVEVLTSKGASPQRDWLEVVKTARARTLIKQSLRNREIPARGVERAKDGAFLLTALSAPDISWSTCCLPTPFVQTVGRLSQDGRWIVHRAKCENAQGELWDPGRWAIMTDTDILNVTFTLDHRPGALLAVLEILAKRGINGHSIQSRSRTSESLTITLEMGGKCPEILGKVLRELARVDTVKSVRGFYWRQ